MQKIFILIIGIVLGLAIGFIVGNHGPVYATGYITGQLDLVSDLQKRFPHNAKNDSYKTVEGLNVKDRYIRIIEVNGVKTLDVV